MVDDAQRSDGDRVLWRLGKPDREIVCRVREIRTGTGYVALELRVEHNGQIYRTEVHQERVAFSRRVDELRRMLETEGWITATKGSAS
jgi:hypothetical protein